MPIIKSAIKRNRQQAKRHAHNLKVKALVKADIKQVVAAITAGDAKAIESAYKAAQSELDRAIKKGTLHKNTAARKKSRLVALITASKSATTKTAAATKPKTAVKKPTAKKKPASKKSTTK